MLVKSVIPLSCTILQRITNLEKKTDEYKERMKDFRERLRNKWDAKYSDIRDTIKDIPQPR